jgi:outer membrane immunogenic protein
MRRILLGSVAIVALHTGYAQAADLPAKVYTKAPAAVAAGFSWTGFYLGGGGGEGFLTDETIPLNNTTGGAALPGSSSVTNAARGAFGTVSAGYDYQFSDRIVGGVLANYDFSNIRGTYDSGAAVGVFEPLGGSRKLESSWAVGARAGWLVDPKTLTYFNAGYTQAHFSGMNLVDLSPAVFPPGPGVVSGHTYNGWFLGSGIETKLDFLPGNGWFARTEYRYARYDAATQPVLTAAGAAFVVSGVPLALQTHPSVQTIRTELVYKFNTGGGSVSTYPAMPTKAAVMPVSWTGFYIGGGGGYGVADAFTTPINSVTGTPFNSGADNGARGYFGSVSGGYDYQFNDKIVAGVLANYDFADIHGNSSTHAYTFFFEPFGGAARLSSSWGVGGRVGWLVTPKTLTYLNGGYTQARYDAMTLVDLGTGIPVGASVGAHTNSGWFLGTGVESKLDILPGNGWFLRTEYRYADYGSATTAATTTAGAPFFPNGVAPLSMRSDVVVQTVRTELSYKFNWGSPVVAKY